MSLDLDLCLVFGVDGVGWVEQDEEEERDVGGGVVFEVDH